MSSFRLFEGIMQTENDRIDMPVIAEPRRLADYVSLVLRGFAMGASDVVPGVSGGTMALILGIYEELIDSIRGLTHPNFLKTVFRFRLREALKMSNWPFLAAVGTGILLAVISLARGLEWVLEHHPVLLWSFFFGLVLASVVIVSQRIRHMSVLLALTMTASAAGVYWLVGLVPAQTPDTWWFLFLSGALAICAMILPGISGAFILVLLGKYEYLLSALSSGDVLTIGLVMAGAVVGLVTFAQLIGWLLKRFHDITIALLTGLMVGSLRKLWPWKIDLAFVPDSHGGQLPILQKNVLPDLLVNGTLNTEVILALVFALIGLACVLALNWQARRLKTTAQDIE